MKRNIGLLVGEMFVEETVMNVVCIKKIPSADYQLISNLPTHSSTQKFAPEDTRNCFCGYILAKYKIQKEGISKN